MTGPSSHLPALDSPVPTSPFAAARLEVTALECVRGDETIFEGLDLVVGGGEILQILGANGSGKTSLLRILSGLATPMAGRIQWRATGAAAAWQQALLYVSHAGGVTPALTVTENLRLAMAIAARPPLGALPAVLARMGIAHLANVYAGRLSAGQRQRVALARLLLIPALAWLLDEPLTALDAAGKALVEELLDEHAGRGGLALVATHQALEIPPRRLRTLTLSPGPRE